MTLTEILNKFKLNGKIVKIEPCGNGRINKTFKVTTHNVNNDTDYKYILQRINTDLFTKPKELMKNIENVTSFIEKNKSKSSKMQVIKIIKNNNGANYIETPDGCFRVYEYIENSVSHDSCIGNPRLFEDCGRIFGEFQSILDKFDASNLYETIPNFHNTKLRYETFLKAIASADAKRLKDAKTYIVELRHYGETLGLASKIVDKLENHTLPLRVTHNDTKLNNVAFDRNTDEAIAVLDLDTIMPGAICYDYGDALRSGCNTENEESIDFKNINFNKELFESFTSGYLKSASNFLTKEEVDSLIDGAMVITFELSLRFLTDFLQNDIYFGAKQYDSNLNRAINQLSLLNKMKENEDYMKNFVSSEYKKYSLETQNL